MNENFRDKFYFSHLQKQEIKSNKGITLIALIITIIVLLILAGVSIAMLTGENGILKRANEAVDITKYKTAEEKVNLAIIGAMADDGQMTVAELKREVGYQSGSVTGDAFPVQVQMDGHTFTVDAEGNINNNGSSGENKPPVHQEALGTVTGNETTNTVVQDNLGNQVVIPPGFIVQNPNNNVTDGIIIQDVDTNRPTCGSEFVWIPVGIINKPDGSTETIKLSRYKFERGGNIYECGEELIDNLYLEQEMSNLGNTTAKNLTEFKKSVSQNKGYYIGRHEARDGEARAPRYGGSGTASHVTCTPNNYVYTFVTQVEAARLSRNMYKDEVVHSDLLNSYAWDTALVFIQNFGKDEGYLQSCGTVAQTLDKGSVNTSYEDVECNIYDLPGNEMEWTTETVVNNGEDCCLFRGGYYYNSGSLATVGERSWPGDIATNGSFRPILYINS